MKWIHLTICCALVSVPPLTLSQAGDYEISRSTIDGGGVMHSTGGQLVLSGTIGQPDAGVMTGPGFELTGGFWLSIGAGDCDEDGVLGLADTAGLAGCLSGPLQAAGRECACFDANADGRVDMTDFAVIQNRRGM